MEGLKNIPSQKCSVHLVSLRASLIDTSAAGDMFYPSVEFYSIAISA
jgi:hypothetical protein